jgi:hypothetical protein
VQQRLAEVIPPLVEEEVERRLARLVPARVEREVQRRLAVVVEERLDSQFSHLCSQAAETRFTAHTGEASVRQLAFVSRGVGEGFSRAPHPVRSQLGGRLLELPVVFAGLNNNLPDPASASGEPRQQ